MAVGTTWRTIANSIQMSLKEQFADREIGIKEIIYWCKMSMNKVKNDRIEKDQHITGNDIATFLNVPISTYPSNSGNMFQAHKYLTLPQAILGLEYDNGVNFIKYMPPAYLNCCEMIFIQRSTLAQLELMKCSPFEKPSYKQPYFIQHGYDLVFYGLEGLPIDGVDMALVVAESPNIDSTCWDDEVQANEEDILLITQMVLTLGNWVMLTPKERVVEGADLRLSNQSRSPVEIIQSQGGQQPQQNNNG